MLINAILESQLRHNSEVLLENTTFNDGLVGYNTIKVIDRPGTVVTIHTTTNASTMWMNQPYGMTKWSMPAQRLPFHRQYGHMTGDIQIQTYTLEPPEGVRTPVPVRRDTIQKYDIVQTDNGIVYRNPTPQTLYSNKSYAMTNRRQNTSVAYLRQNTPLFIPDNPIHNISAYGDCRWVTVDTIPTTNYEPVCWSNRKLEVLRKKGLFVKPTREQLVELLLQRGLIYDRPE